MKHPSRGRNCSPRVSPPGGFHAPYHRRWRARHRRQYFRLQRPGFHAGPPSRSPVGERPRGSRARSPGQVPRSGRRRGSSWRGWRCGRRGHRAGRRHRHRPPSITVAQCGRARRAVRGPAGCLVRRTQLHRPRPVHAERSELSAIVGTRERRPDDQRDSGPGRFGHPRGPGVGHHRGVRGTCGGCDRYRRRLHPSRSGGQHVVGSGAVHGRSWRRHRRHLRGRHARLQRHRTDLRSDGRSLPRHACRRDHRRRWQ